MDSRQEKGKMLPAPQECGGEGKGKEQPCSTELALIIHQALVERGAQTVKQWAECTGLSGELIRRILIVGHVPKDRTLVRIAQGLGLEPSVLILAAHRLKMPADLLSEMLPIEQPAGGNWQYKRKWPLSQEQCEYLGRFMRIEEIRLIRKMRQLSSEGKQQLVGYVNYMFATRRVPPPLPQAEQGAAGEGGGAGTSEALA